jgi:hypothetical protein
MAEAVTSLFCAIANARGCAAGGNQGFSAMCDDMIYLGPHHLATRAVDILAALLVEVGATEALDKRLVGPAGEVLGKLFDLPAGTVSLAPQRLHKYFANLELARLALSSSNAAVRAEITPTFLSKLTGTLAWLAETSISGATHLSGLYSVTAGNTPVESNLAAVLRDLNWWSAAARSGRVSAALLLHHDLPTFEVATDASDGALGAVSGSNAVWRTLSAKERTLSSARRELRAFIMALEVYGPVWSGGHLMIQSDSLSGALAFNRGRIRGDGGQDDVERCYALMEQFNIHAVCAYLPREFNLVADSLSKVATSAGARGWAHRRAINITIHWEWRAAQAAAGLAVAAIAGVAGAPAAAAHPNGFWSGFLSQPAASAGGDTPMWQRLMPAFGSPMSFISFLAMPDQLSTDPRSLIAIMGAVGLKLMAIFGLTAVALEWHEPQFVHDQERSFLITPMEPRERTFVARLQ